MNEKLKEKILSIPQFEQYFDVEKFFNEQFNISDEFFERIFSVGFDDKQLLKILIGVKWGYSEEALELCLNSEFSPEQIHEMLIWWFSGLLNFDVSVEQLKPWARPDIPLEVIGSIPAYIRDGLTAEQIEFCINEADGGRRFEISRGFAEGLSMEQVLIYSKPEFSAEQACVLRILLCLGVPIEEVSLYATPKYTWAKLSVIAYGYDNGLTKEEIAKFANPKLKMSQMQRICDKLIKEKNG